MQQPQNESQLAGNSMNMYANMYGNQMGTQAGSMGSMGSMGMGLDQPAAYGQQQQPGFAGSMCNFSGQMNNSRYTSMPNMYSAAPKGSEVNWAS